MLLLQIKTNAGQIFTSVSLSLWHRLHPSLIGSNEDPLISITTLTPSLPFRARRKTFGVRIQRRNEA